MFGQKKKLIVNKRDIDQAILAKNTKISNENKKLANIIKSKKAEIKASESEIKKCISRQEDEKKVIADLYAESLALEDTIKSSKSKLSKLKASSKTLDSNIKGLIENESKLIYQIDKLDKELEKKNKEKAVILEYIASNNSIKSTLKKSQASLDSLEKEITEGKGEYVFMS